MAIAGPPEEKQHEIPGVGVLPAAVQQHQLGLAAAPLEQAHLVRPVEVDDCLVTVGTAARSRPSSPAAGANDANSSGSVALMPSGYAALPV